MITPRNRFLGHPCNAAKGFYKSRATEVRPPSHRGSPCPGRPSPHVPHKVLQALPRQGYRSPSALTLASCVSQGDSCSIHVPRCSNASQQFSRISRLLTATARTAVRHKSIPSQLISPNLTIPHRHHEDLSASSKPARTPTVSYDSLPAWHHRCHFVKIRTQSLDRSSRIFQLRTQTYI